MKPLFCALTLLLSCLLVSKAEATTQVLSITGSYTSSKAPNGDVTITFANGVVVFEAAQPVPIVVVGLKKTGQTITITNPNHVSISISGNNTSDAIISGPSYRLEYLWHSLRRGVFIWSSTSET